MCHFISLVVEGGDPIAIDAAMKAVKRRASPADAAPLQRVLKAGERVFWTSGAGCDCGTVLGARAAAEGDEGEGHAARARLRRKGWSEARIERALAEQAKAKARPDGRGDSVELWEQALKSILGLPGVKAAGLLVHDYGEEPGEEGFAAGRREWPGQGSILEALRSLREDELVMFRS